MAIDAWTIIFTAMFTGIGVSVGNGLFEAFFKDYFRKLNKHNKELRKKLHKKLLHYKHPWIALLLNVFLWGTGYFYVEKKRWLGAFLLLIQIFIVGGYAYSKGSITNVFEGITSGFLTILISIYLGYDAYKIAKQENEEK